MIKKRDNKNMLYIEECFLHIKEKDGVTNQLKAIERTIEREFDIHTTISIIENSTVSSKKVDFFGMHIFPSTGTMDKIIDILLDETERKSTAIVNELWRQEKNWIIEIDSLLLYNTNLMSTPAEITAVLLHEIGHTVHSNSVPERIRKVIRYKLADMDFKTRRLIKTDKIAIRKFLRLPLIEGCMVRNFNHSLGKELNADGYTSVYGYDKHMCSFLDKLLKAYGNSLLEITEAEKDNEIECMMNWCLTNIGELEFRRTKLQRELSYEAMNNPSKFIRANIVKIESLFFATDDTSSKYTAAVKEQYIMKTYNSICMEGFKELLDKFGKVKKIDEYQIDLIAINIERIEDHDDKAFVLTELSMFIEKVKYYQQLIVDGKGDKVPHSKEKLTGMENRLTELYKRAVAVKIKEKTYGINIVYPKGFEG